jgi:hypothetical protein
MMAIFPVPVESVTVGTSGMRAAAAALRIAPFASSELSRAMPVALVAAYANDEVELASDAMAATPAGPVVRFQYGTHPESTRIG